MTRYPDRGQATVEEVAAPPQRDFVDALARLQAERLLGHFPPRNHQHHNFEEEIHGQFAAQAAMSRNVVNSRYGRRRIPPERLWLRAPPPETGPAGP